MKERTILYGIIFSLILVSVLLWQKSKREPYVIDQTKKYEREMDSLNRLIIFNREQIDRMRAQKRVSDSLINSYEEKIKTFKPKINETNSAIIRLSTDSTIKLFAREITGSNFSR